MVDIIRKPAQEETYADVDGTLIPARYVVGQEGGGGGASAVTIADGADEAIGAKSDAAWNESDPSPSGISIWKRIAARVATLGASSDTVWSGSGDGTINAILKACFVRLNTIASGVVLNRSGGALNIIINSGQSVSAANLDISSYSAVSIIMPSAFDGTSITFQATNTLAGTLQPVYDRYGYIITVPVAPNRWIDLPAEIGKCAFIRVVSSATESAARTIVLYGKR